MTTTGIYRAVIRLYPREFRARYRDDLVQHFTDLVNERGLRAAWTRTAVDLIVTVPRYRLEAIMNERHSTTTLTVAITLLAAGGLLSVPAGIYPGIVLLPLAGALAVGQRSALARAIRTADSHRRQRRLRPQWFSPSLGQSRRPSSWSTCVMKNTGEARWSSTT
jgi:hypothetical protein